MEEEKEITISKFEYDTLKETKLKYNILMNHIFYGDLTELSYDNKLSINGNSVIKLVKALEPVWYKQVLNEYKSNKEKKQ